WTHPRLNVRRNVTVVKRETNLGSVIVPDSAEKKPSSGDTGAKASSASTDHANAAVLQIVRGLVAELHPNLVDPRLVRLDSDLDRDLALDSLSRAELLMRLDRHFKIELPETLLGKANTPQDIVEAVVEAAPSAVERFRGAPQETLELEAVQEPIEAATLIEALTQRAQRSGQRDHVLLWKAGGRSEPLTYGELYREACAAAGGLVECGIGIGDRVAIMLPTGRDFFMAFFGVLFAGAIPVPIYPPFRLAQIEEHLLRQAAILTNAGATALITSREIRLVAGLLSGLVRSLRHIGTV